MTTRNSGNKPTCRTCTWGEPTTMVECGRSDLALCEHDVVTCHAWPPGDIRRPPIHADEWCSLHSDYNGKNA